MWFCGGHAQAAVAQRVRQRCAPKHARAPHTRAFHLAHQSLLGKGALHRDAGAPKHRQVQGLTDAGIHCLAGQQHQQLHSLSACLSCTHTCSCTPPTQAQVWCWCSAPEQLRSSPRLQEWRPLKCLPWACTHCTWDGKACRQEHAPLTRAATQLAAPAGTGPFRMDATSRPTCSSASWPCPCTPVRAIHAPAEPPLILCAGATLYWQACASRAHLVAQSGAKLT